MHTGDDDFLNAVIGDAARLLNDVGKRTARHAPPDIRNDAVSAESTASILHLDECARPFPRTTHAAAETGVLTNCIVLHRLKGEAFFLCQDREGSPIGEAWHFSV